MGRYSNEKRAQIAAEAAAKAAQAVQAAPPEAEASTKAAKIPQRPEGWTPPLRNEPRRLAMEEIEVRDLKTKGIEIPKEELESEIVPARIAPAPVAEPAPETPAPDVKPVETPPAEPIKMVKVKVDGQEFEVAQTEVDEAGGVTAYQKDKAAENRLRKANETLAESRRIQAEIAQWIQQQTKPAVETDDQFIASKIDVIRFGTPEESAAALKAVLERSKIDQNAVTRNAVTIMQRNLALDIFKKEFQDVASNPDLLRLAVFLENELIPQAGPNLDWQNFYRSIGNRVRSVVGRPSQSATTPTAAPTSDTPSPASDKEARKASIVNLPVAAARAELPKEEKPETREDVLNQMRKSRGIPTG